MVWAEQLTQQASKLQKVFRTKVGQKSLMKGRQTEISDESKILVMIHRLVRNSGRGPYDRVFWCNFGSQNFLEFRCFRFKRLN